MNEEWYAIRTRHEQKAERQLSEICSDLLVPRETIQTEERRRRSRWLIPHVLFVKTTPDKLLEFERKGREWPEMNVPIWIYRYPKDNSIQKIPESSIHLLRLLSSDDTTRCEIYHNTEFRANQKVRVTSGPFQGYEGHVVRVRKNKHVAVRIEGVCMVLLPFIHPSLLTPMS